MELFWNPVTMVISVLIGLAYQLYGQFKKQEELRRLLANMWFAYANKDEDFPHGFELMALRDVVNYFARGQKIDQSIVGEPYRTAWREAGKYMRDKRSTQK